MTHHHYITISEFRKNTKVILDAAKTESQILRRGDDLYDLVYRGNIFTPVPLNTMISVTGDGDTTAWKPTEGVFNKAMISKRGVQILDEIKELKYEPLD